MKIITFFLFIILLTKFSFAQTATEIMIRNVNIISMKDDKIIIDLQNGLIENVNL